MHFCDFKAWYFADECLSVSLATCSPEENCLSNENRNCKCFPIGRDDVWMYTLEKGVENVSRLVPDGRMCGFNIRQRPVDNQGKGGFFTGRQYYFLATKLA